jgi:hypothetical protein
MKSMSLLVLSTGFALTAATLSAAASTTSRNATGTAAIAHSSPAFTVSSNANQIAREKQPNDDRGKKRKDLDPAKHKLVASGGKSCKVYYGCITPTPVPTKGKKGGGDDPQPHKLAPDSTVVQIARENEPGDDRRHKRDHDKRDDRRRHGSGHKLVETIA